MTAQCVNKIIIIKIDLLAVLAVHMGATISGNSCKWQRARNPLYHRVPKVAGPVTFGISRLEGPQLSGGCYYRVAVTFG